MSLTDQYRSEQQRLASGLPCTPPDPFITDKQFALSVGMRLRCFHGLIGGLIPTPHHRNEHGAPFWRREDAERIVASWKSPTGLTAPRARLKFEFDQNDGHAIDRMAYESPALTPAEPEGNLQ